MTERHRIKVQGIVQGVGFRPFVYGLATRTALLAGYVLNDASGVTIEVEGESPALNDFLFALRTEAPPLAVVERITTEVMSSPDNGKVSHGFYIEHSPQAASASTLISPDVTTCDDCVGELFDRADRRYHYPFINCTNCGPRFTIIRDIPYDRQFTTMSAFRMCDDCKREYDDPGDRRFHAQPNACPVCGPRIRFVYANSSSQSLEQEDALEAAQELLFNGGIVAIKGLGGYHLACDAMNAKAVQRLRERKHRWDKPFALMGDDLTTIESVCNVTEAERALLISRRRPIVLLHRKRDDGVAPDVAPRQVTLGIMLPYTPLHYLLFADNTLSKTTRKLLVMTSGNRSDEPIAYRDKDAFTRLASLADAFLTHNRDIHMRCDDSVTRVVKGVELLIRRSRSYAPQPLRTSFEFRRTVLAVGAHLKNTFCLGRDRYAFLSHHIGDLENFETLSSFEEGVKHFKRLFDLQPEVIAHDLHPDYLSTRYALETDGVQRVAVQHHHAHIASVMAEHSLTGPVIGVAFDGTGYGTDGNVWGGEFLVADLADFERVAHLINVPLPGGEQAILQPWRVGAAWLYKLYGDEWLDWGLRFCQNVDREAWIVLRQMIERGVNSPLTSSMGRLFDAVAALLGVRDVVNYEGQAAVELEAIADENEQVSYSFELVWPAVDPAPMFAALLSDLRAGVPATTIAARFHNGVAALVVAVCLRLRNEQDLKRVALSGGVFQNAFLLSRTLDQLCASNFETYTNQRVPPNDGGISLGQATIANARML